MKILLSSILILVFQIGYTQTSVSFTLDGLTEDVNNSFKDGELIKNLSKQDKRKYLFYATVQNTDGGTKQYVRIQQEVKPDADGKYSFSIPFTVNQKGSLDFSKEIKIRIEGVTTFGNLLWVEKVLTPKDFIGSLVIDNYGSSSKYKPESTKVVCTFVTPRKTSKIVEELLAAGDDLLVLTPADFHVKFRNTDTKEWVINESAGSQQVNSGKTLVYTLDPETTPLDLYKPIQIQVCIPTQKGSFISSEWTLNPWELGDSYAANQKYGTESLCGAVPETKMPEKENEKEPVKKEKEDIGKEDKEQKEDTEKEDELKEKEKGDVKLETKEPPISQRPIMVEKCKTDSLTKQLVLTGGKLCVNSIAVSRGTTNSAMLLFDTDYTIEGNTFPLSGGTKITYHNKKNYLLSATLKGSVTVNHSVGTLNLKPDQKVEFSQKGLAGAKLAQNTTIAYKGVSLVCATTKNKFDLEFDGLGRLESLTLADNANWNISTGELTLQAGSELYFKNGYLARVKSEQPTEVDLVGKTFSVVKHNKKASIEFSNANVIQAVVVGEGNNVEVAGYQVDIEPGSQMEVVFDGTAYSVSSVVLGQPITVEVSKGSKVTSVEAKAGKKLIIKEGKIVKVK